MHTMEKLSAKVALKLVAITGLVVSSLALPNIAIAYGSIAREWKKYKRGDIGRIIKRFQKSELIAVREQNGQTVIEISEKGKAKLLKYDFDNLTLKKKRDGKSRVVIFDIPNTKKASRDIFRRKIEGLGFIKLQESVFVSAYPCREEIEFIVNFLFIEKYVSLFQMGKIELGPELQFKKFT